VSGSRLCVERGVRYHFRLWGSQRVQAPAVVFLHGFAGSARDWDRFGELVDRTGLRAIAVDLPGHGDSEAPEDPARFTIEQTARDLGAILDLSGLTEAHWVGYSMGGRVALHLAAAVPARVRSLLIESASPGIEGEEERAVRRASDEALAAEIERRGIEWFAEHWSAQPIFATQESLPARTRAAIREARLRNRPAGLAGSLRGLGQGTQPWLGPKLSSITCPALFVTGALDAKYGAIAERTAAAVPGARHLSVADAGHNVHLEQPEAFERALHEHLAPVAGAARASARSSLQS
jgi:2-succinyl-6-hydroxy-2,4-cyclohexadiene-1-carboxylate synthase